MSQPSHVTELSIGPHIERSFASFDIGIVVALALTMFTTIEDEKLTSVTGANALGLAYKFGYKAGGFVTRIYEKTKKGAQMVVDPSNSSRMIPQADIPVVGPILTRKGFPNVGAGATDVVNDMADLHAVPR